MEKMFCLHITKMHNIPHPHQKARVQLDNQHGIQSLFLQQVLVYYQQASHYLFFGI